MTDLHTHILPGIDDGAANVEQSLAMLRAQRDQGVDTVVLTPHFYREDESIEDFLARRQEAYRQLLEAIGDEPMPKLMLGAEVYWYPGISQQEGLEKLCLEGTDWLLLELPYAQWTDRILEEVDRIPALTGLTPLIAHVDRYFRFQKKGQIELLHAMGFPLQINAIALASLLSRRRLLPLLRDGNCFIGSDCHGPVIRPPRMDQAVLGLKKYPDLQYALEWQPM